MKFLNKESLKIILIVIVVIINIFAVIAVIISVSNTIKNFDPNSNIDKSKQIIEDDRNLQNIEDNNESDMMNMNFDFKTILNVVLQDKDVRKSLLMMGTGLILLAIAIVILVKTKK